MSVSAFTRVCELGTLPKLVAEAAGPKAVEQLFNEQEVPVALLETPGAPLLYRDCLGLYRKAADITTDRSLGLRVGTDVSVRNLGLFGQYVAAAPSLGRALVRCKDTIGFHTNRSSVDVEHHGNNIKLVYRCSEQGKVGWDQYADVMVCVMVDIVRCYLGPVWVPKWIEVGHCSNARRRDVEDHFGVPVLISRHAAAIVFGRALVGVVQSDRPASRSLVTRADVERYGQSLPKDVVGATVEIVRQRLLRGRTDLEGAADKLGLAPRTFQRRLSEEGASYKCILSVCRRKRAANMLARDEFSVADIADLLGYASQSHFSRAFKQWMGVAPGVFRSSVHYNA